MNEKQGFNGAERLVKKVLLE